MNIGKMLLELNKKAGNADLILCNGLYSPMIVKIGNKIHDFIYEEQEHILKRIPTDSFWYQLEGKETITISQEEIINHAKELKLIETKFSDKYSLQKSAESLMKERLKEHNKDVGIFTNNKNKLVVSILQYFYPEVFVEKSSFDYKL